MMAGDAWASGIVRIMFYDEGKVSPLPVVFFMSYMMVAGVVLLNIVVAGMPCICMRISTGALFVLSSRSCSPRPLPTDTASEASSACMCGITRL